MRTDLLLSKTVLLRLTFLFGLCVSFVFSAAAKAEDIPPPPGLVTLMEIEPENQDVEDLTKQAPNIRLEAIKDAALSYGARGSLAHRTYEVRQDLKRKAHYMDQTFSFNRLLISGPSGLLIEPPIVSETLDALLIEDEGQTAAVSELMLRINKKAKIVPVGRNWRDYLERDWGKVSPPPDLLLPRDHKEREIWREYVERGWKEGYEQGSEIFQADLNRLIADFEGMVRYRMLLKQRMISAPFALLEERGVTGGGDELRIGDRAVQITGPSQLQARPEEWQPASR